MNRTPNHPLSAAIRCAAVTLTLSSDAAICGPLTRRDIDPRPHPTILRATFYVALDGNDSWSGTLPASNPSRTDGPFATFDRARAVVRALDNARLREVDVQFRAGTYFLPATVQFTEADSGSANTEMVYENYPGEAPVFSGGVRVTQWTNVGGATWQTLMPAGTKYFENLFYKDCPGTSVSYDFVDAWMASSSY